MGNFHKTIREGTVPVPALLLPTGCQHCQGAAMIVAVPVNDFVLALLVFGNAKVKPGHLKRFFIGFGAAVGNIDFG